MNYIKKSTAFLEKAGWSILQTLAKLIDGLIKMLFGRSLGLASKVPQLKTTAADVAQAIRETAAPTVPDAYSTAHQPALTLYQYVAAKDATERAMVDLTGFTDGQLDWLLSLSDEHLERLAAAGPEACERALGGKKCGIVGLPLPKTKSAASMYNGQGAEAPAYESKMARRIRAYRDENEVDGRFRLAM